MSCQGGIQNIVRMFERKEGRSEGLKNTHDTFVKLYLFKGIAGGSIDMQLHAPSCIDELLNTLFLFRLKKGLLLLALSYL